MAVGVGVGVFVAVGVGVGVFVAVGVGVGVFVAVGVDVGVFVAVGVGVGVFVAVGVGVGVFVAVGVGVGVLVGVGSGVGVLVAVGSGVGVFSASFVTTTGASVVTLPISFPQAQQKHTKSAITTLNTILFFSFFPAICFPYQSAPSRASSPFALLTLFAFIFFTRSVNTTQLTIIRIDE